MKILQKLWRIIASATANAKQEQAEVSLLAVQEDTARKQFGEALDWLSLY